MKDPDIISDTRENHQTVDKSKQQSGTTGSPLINKKLTEIFDVKSISKNINVLKCNNQIKELHTVIRDRLG